MINALPLHNISSDDPSWCHDVGLSGSDLKLSFLQDSGQATSPAPQTPENRWLLTLPNFLRRAPHVGDAKKR